MGSLTVLNNQSAFQVLLNQAAIYSILIRNFGCVCYPLMLRPYKNHKLILHSQRCIFLGYSANHRGYRCLDPITNRVYLRTFGVWWTSISWSKRESQRLSSCYNRFWPSERISLQLQLYTLGNLFSFNYNFTIYYYLA